MGKLQKEFVKKDTFLRRWAAVIILVILFITSWGGQFVAQMQVVQQQSQEHGQEFTMEEFWPEFWSATFENWQSEWFQLTIQAILITGLADFVFRRGNEDHYKTQLMIEELREEIKELKN